MTGEKETVAVIDDDELIRTMFGLLFAEEGFDVLTAENGEEGVRLILENPQIRWVICDFDMPGMNGWRVWQSVKEELKARQGRFVCCSGGPPPGGRSRVEFDRLHGEVLGIEKPAGISVLLQAIRGLPFRT